MTVDADTYRRDSLESWNAVAPGWARRQAAMREFTAPLAQVMVDEIRPQPGHIVLELAAGVGETGFLAAELVQPGGKLISSDQSEAMLDAARARAQGLGLGNVEFKLISAESIDLAVASVDSVLCRFGFMLMADPPAALAESRRVLRPEGRLAMAVWDTVERNPWLSVPGRLMVERGLMERPDPETPNPFAMAEPGRLNELLDEAGFTDVEVLTVDLVNRQPSLEAFWEMQMDMSPGFQRVVDEHSPEEVEAFRSALAERMAQFADGDGALAIPAAALVATASA